MIVIADSTTVLVGSLEWWSDEPMEVHMPLDFAPVDAAYAELSIRLTELKAADEALTSAVGARDAAKADLAAKEQSVADAQSALSTADGNADTAAQGYNAALAGIGVG